MLRTLSFAILFLAGCPAPLLVQQTLAQRVHKATLACVALTTGAAQQQCVARAKLCQSTAKAAAEALQKAQTATAAGNTDIAAEASAAGLGVLADVACKQAGA